MKQNAVDWLEQEFIKLESTTGVFGKMYELLEQAKAMEKEQIEEAYSDGVDDERYDRELKLGKYYQSVFKEDKQ